MEGIFSKRILIVSFLFLLLCPILSVSAQTNESPNGGGPSLMISPVIFDLDMKPGDTLKERVTVVNNSNSSVDIITEVADFTYDKTGEMKFIEENEDNPSVSSVKKWLSYPEKEFTIEGNKTKDIFFDINVPQNGDPGAHYGVIFFRSKPQGGGTIGISARVGALVLVTLPGNTKKTGTVSNFIVGNMGEGNKFTPQNFFETGPVNFSFQVLNTGNVHFKPEGYITIKDMWGNKVAEVAPQDTRAFPGTPRTYVQKSDVSPWGTYEATLNLKDGDGNPMQVLKVGFWGFNYRLVVQWLLITLIVIIVLVFGIKKYNKWIITKATTHHHKK